VQTISEVHAVHSVEHLLQTKPLTYVPVGHVVTHALSCKYLPEAQVVQTEVEVHTSQSVEQLLQTKPSKYVPVGHDETHALLADENPVGHVVTQAS
jgi:hypothetical protein